MEGPNQSSKALRKEGTTPLVYSFSQCFRSWRSFSAEPGTEKSNDDHHQCTDLGQLSCRIVAQGHGNTSYSRPCTPLTRRIHQRQLSN